MKKYLILLLLFLGTTNLHSSTLKQIHVFRKHQILLRFKKFPSSNKNLPSLHKRLNAQVVKAFKSIPRLQLIQLPKSTKLENALEQYRKDPHIEFAEPNYIYKKAQVPNDTYFYQQWALHNTEQNGGFYDADVNGPEAWQVERGSKSYAIAIVDTGIDYNHTDLQTNVWTNLNEIPGNGIDDDNNSYIDDMHGINSITDSGDPMDDEDHGTHVAGIIGADHNNSKGVSGILPNTNIISCKFLDRAGEGDAAGAIDCFDYILALKTRKKNPVNIVAVNNSWAGGNFSTAMFLAIRSLEEAGILFVAAASNEQTNNDLYPVYPANYELSNIISVASTDKSDQLSRFSNFGRYSVHTSAPGSLILSTITKNRYNLSSGTSMATPYVTGIIGLLKSNRPDLTWQQIKNLIIAGGQTLESTTGKTISDRRVRAYDITGESVLNCYDQSVSSLLEPKTKSLTLRIGEQLKLRMISLNCETPQHTIQMLAMSNRTDGLQITLADDGTRGDEVANDGIFTGFFASDRAGKFRIRFNDNDSIIVQVR